MQLSVVSNSEYVVFGHFAIYNAKRNPKLQNVLSKIAFFYCIFPLVSPLVSFDLPRSGVPKILQ